MWLTILAVDFVFERNPFRLHAATPDLRGKVVAVGVVVGLGSAVHLARVHGVEPPAVLARKGKSRAKKQQYVRTPLLIVKKAPYRKAALINKKEKAGPLGEKKKVGWLGGRPRKCSKMLPES